MNKSSRAMPSALRQHTTDRLDYDAMTKSIGICGFYREHQFSSGVYSFVENLLRGFAHVRGDARDHGEFEVVMFHGKRGVRYNDPRITYREIADPRGRYPAETRVGLIDSAGLDAMLF